MDAKERKSAPYPYLTAIQSQHIYLIAQIYFYFPFY